jgi:aryl-alcohol dehydrogenase-like predicted oxidoreductase
MLGHTFGDFLNPQDWEALSGIHHTLRTRGITDHVLRMPRPDGVVVPLGSRTVALGDGDYHCITRDMSAWLRTQEELRQSESYLRTVLANSPVSMLALDSDGIVRIFDRERLKALGVDFADAGLAHHPRNRHTESPHTVSPADADRRGGRGSPRGGRLTAVMMHYRKLGTTGLMVSEVGLGLAGLGHVWGHTADNDAIAAIDAALAAGVNFFDVAPRYGDGRAERNLGRALSERRERAIVASKVFLMPPELDDIPGAIEQGLGESLDRLATDHLDLFQLHNHVTAARGAMPLSLSITDVLGPRGVVETLQRLKSGAQLRFIGFSGLGESQAVRDVMEDGGLDTVQAYYNLLNRSAARPLPRHSGLHDHGDIISLAAERGMGVLGIRNLAGGALSAGLDREVRADSLFARDARRAARLSFLSDDGPPLQQLATCFILSHPAVSTVLPGVKNAAEVADAVAAAQLPPLDAAAVARLDEAAADDFGVPEPTPTTL